MKHTKKAAAFLLSIAMAFTPVLTPVSAEENGEQLADAVIGDIDQNGTEDPEDICLLTDYLHGRTERIPEGFQGADMNGDGETDIFDLGLLKRRVMQNIGGSAKVSYHGVRNVTSAVTPQMWNNIFLPADTFASVQTFVIEDPEELPKALDGLQEAVQRYLSNSYDEAFFKDNVLILHYGYQDSDLLQSDIENVSYQDDVLTVTVGQLQNTHEGGHPQSVEIWRVAVPRSQYNGNGVKWITKDTEYVDVSYDAVTVQDSSLNATVIFDKLLRDEGMVIRDVVSLRDLSEKLFTESEAELLLEKYPEPFFSSKALWISGSRENVTTRSLWQARKVGDTLYADIRVSQSFSEEKERIMHLVSFDKDFEAEHFKRHEVTLPTYPELTGKIACFDGIYQDTALLVNSSYYQGQRDITFYWAHPIGSEPHAALEKIASFAVSEDCSDFEKPYEELSVVRTDTKLDDVRAWLNEEEGYAVILSPDSVTISFMKSKAARDEERITVPYPKRMS